MPFEFSQECTSPAEYDAEFPPRLRPSRHALIRSDGKLADGHHPSWQHCEMSANMPVSFRSFVEHRVLPCGPRRRGSWWTSSGATAHEIGVSAQLRRLGDYHADDYKDVRMTDNCASVGVQTVHEQQQSTLWRQIDILGGTVPETTTEVELASPHQQAESTIDQSDGSGVRYGRRLSAAPLLHPDIADNDTTVATRTQPEVTAVQKLDDDLELENGQVVSLVVLSLSIWRSLR